MDDKTKSKDPYAEFGGSVATDPYAEFGGKSSASIGKPKTREEAMAANAETSKGITNQEAQYIERPISPEDSMKTETQRYVEQHGVPYRAAAGAGRFTKGAFYDLPTSVLEKTQENIKSGNYDNNYIGGPAGPAFIDALSSKLWTEPREQLQTKALKEDVAGNPRAGQAYQIAAAFPPIGGAITSLTERASEGDVAGAGGEATAAYLIPKVASKIPAATRIGLQEINGAGKEAVAAAERARAERVAHNEGRTQEILANHQEKLASAKADFDKAMAEWEQSTGEKKAAHEAKVKDAQKKWVEKAMAAERDAEAATQAKAKRETLEAGQNAAAQKLHENIQDTHRAVKSSLDQRWNGLRDKVGRDTPLDSVKVKEAIDTAKDKYLLGSPENLKVFNDLTNQMVDEAAGKIDTPEGAQPILKPLTWEEARVHSSALGEKMYSGELPANVRKAIGSVREAVESELQNSADSKGAGKEYRKLKGDWSQYEDDWRDTSALSSGGSPLAKSIKSPTPEFTKSWTLGKGGDLVAQKLARYKQFGGNPELASTLRQLADEAKKIPNIKATIDPKEAARSVPKPGLPPPPKMSSAPEMKTVAEPKLPGQEPPIDPREIRLRKLEQHSGRPFKWYDAFPPFFVERMALKSPAIRKWVADQPRNEIPIRYGIPPPPTPTP